ncbi:hypothetical protein RDI58_018812 [Solanum bulbocastanum]|uniref:Uncharacterized protein n=1 Tax=Solanum bulbocastanum TaxID=147425 RepID=A0AAN8THM5_SOLBU
MNFIWEKVMSSLRAQNFQRVLIQKVNARIRLAQVCRVILITPSFRFQRIAIARALLKNAPILILDEVVFAGVYIRSARFSGEVQVKRIIRAILEGLIHLRI